MLCGAVAFDDLMPWPAAAAVFPADIFQLPLSWIQNSYNLKRYKRFSDGGHFSAMEQPIMLANDIKQWFLIDYSKIAVGRTKL